MNQGRVYLLDSMDAYGWARKVYNVVDWDGKTAAIDAAVDHFDLPTGTHKIAVVTPGDRVYPPMLGIFNVHVSTVTTRTVSAITKGKA